MYRKKQNTSHTYVECILARTSIEKTNLLLVRYDVHNGVCTHLVVAVRSENLLCTTLLANRADGQRGADRRRRNTRFSSKASLAASTSW